MSIGDFNSIPPRGDAPNVSPNTSPKDVQPKETPQIEDSVFVETLQGWSELDKDTRVLATNITETDIVGGGGHAGKKIIDVEIGGVTKHFFAKPVEGRTGEVELMNYKAIEHFEQENIDAMMAPAEKQELDGLRSRDESFIKAASDSSSNTPANQIAEPLTESESERLKELQQKETKQQNAPRLTDYMPKRYGVVTIDGQQYLLMENMKIGDEGQPLDDIADLKTAAKPKEAPKKFNSIYHKEEHVALGMHKKAADAKQMHLQYKEDGYLFVTGSGVKRFINYTKSETLLTNSLDNTSDEDLLQLEKDFQAINFLLESLPVALIGASVVLYQDPQSGKITPKLIDPAHMQVDPNLSDKKKAVLEENVGGTPYYGTEDNYKLQRESNQTSLDRMQRAVSSKRITGIAKRSSYPTPRRRRSSVTKKLRNYSTSFRSSIGKLSPRAPRREV